MKNFKIAPYGAALFTISCEAGANATTTVTFNYAAGGATENITLVGASAQYQFYDSNSIQYFSSLSPSSGYGSFASTARLPTFASAYLNESQAVSVSNNFKTVSPALQTDTNNDPYLQLAFVSGGQAYVGVASFASNAELESITYSAAPEPDSWALLLSGVGMVGAMLRRRAPEGAARAHGGLSKT